MQIPVRRTAVAAVSVLALSGIAAGCGSDSKDDAKAASSGASSSASADSSTSTAPSTSASAGASPSTGTGAGSPAAALTKDNFVAALTSAIKDHKSAHLTMSFEGALSASGDVSYAGSTPTMRLTMTMGAVSGQNGQKIEMRFVDGTMYLQVPGMTPAGKFLSVGKDDATFGPMLEQLQNFGPNGAVAMMDKGVKDFRHVGSATIDGKSYEHYRVTVDPSAVAGDLNLPSQGAGKIPKSVTEDLYLDADHLMRRATMEVQGHKVVVDATDWGKPVHVAKPKAADLVKMPGGAGM
jgi:hypothetical protein